MIEEVPCDSETLDEFVVEVAVSPFDELVGVVAEARRHGLADGHLATVNDLLIHGTGVDVAAARSISTCAVRYRQRHAIDQIRRLVAA